MEFWLIKYDGHWMGGTVIVCADTEEEALELAAKDPKTVNFMLVTVEQLSVSSPCVLYNDNGDS